MGRDLHLSPVRPHRFTTLLLYGCVCGCCLPLSNWYECCLWMRVCWTSSPTQCLLLTVTFTEAGTGQCPICPVWSIWAWKNVSNWCVYFIFLLYHSSWKGICLKPSVPKVLFVPINNWLVPLGIMSYDVQDVVVVSISFISLLLSFYSLVLACDKNKRLFK